MRKKRIVSTFNHGSERNTNQRVFARKTSGNQPDEINNSSSGINFRNEKVKVVVSLSESVQNNDYVSKNLSRDINSTKDSEHYFAGNKKTVDLKLSFFSRRYCFSIRSV
jgi:hypothetical protein